MNIAHTDGGTREFFAVSAAVILTADGDVFERSEVFLGNWSSNFAEYHGVILALKTALQEDLKQIHIRSDSELVVKQLNGRYKIRSGHLRVLAQEAMKLGRLLEEVSIEHVPREMNLYPDFICNVKAETLLLGVRPDREVRRDNFQKKLELARRYPPSGILTDCRR